MATAKILIIEDNALNMELAQDLLEIKGFRVITAESAEEGLRLAREEVPDLVLMDISLPGMDGLAATYQLKQDDATKDISVVCMTAHAMEGDLEKAKKAGAKGYITKPIDTREFANQVEAYLEG